MLPIAGTALLTARTLARYHFPEDEREQLKQLCTRLKDTCSDQISCRFAACPEKEDRLAASMTLGKGVDELQEKLQKQDMLLESYMVETLAGEALMEAYSRFHAEIHRRTGWFVKQMSFLGSSSGIEFFAATIESKAKLVYDQVSDWLENTGDRCV